MYLDPLELSNQLLMFSHTSLAVLRQISNSHFPRYKICDLCLDHFITSFQVKKIQKNQKWV